MDSKDPVRDNCCHTVQCHELNKLFSLKEASEVLHLPQASHDENGSLSNCPPQHPLVGALACLTEPLLTILYTHTHLTLYTHAHKANSAFHPHGVDKWVVSFISWCYNCSFSRGAPWRTTGKCRCGVIGREHCDPHLSALEVRFSRRGAIQIDVYLRLPLHTYTVSQKNCTLFVSSITLSNVDRF